MSKTRKKTAKRVPTRKPNQRTAGKPNGSAAEAPAHLPLQESAPTSLTPLVDSKPPAKYRDRTVLPSNSLVRQKVLAIIALRLEGKKSDEISATLGISEASIRQYMWLAGKNGWLKKHVVDPKDRLEFEIAHKVVRNLDEMLDSDDVERRDTATLKTADGMFFKPMSQDQNVAPPVTMIGVRVEVVPGTSNELREGTTGGAGHFLEGETVGNS